MNQSSKLRRKSRARSIWLVIGAASFGSTFAQACSDPFESCQERRACPLGGSGGGLGHAGEGGEPVGAEGGAIGETGGAANLAGGGVGPSAQGGEHSAGGIVSEPAGGIGGAGEPPAGVAGDGGGDSTAAGSGGAGSTTVTSGGALGHAGTTSAGGTAAGGAGTSGGMTGTGGKSSNGGATAAGGALGSGGQPGSGGQSPGWGSCAPGETKLCSELFPAISECTQKTVTCMSNSHWPDATVACVPTRRDCRSANDNNCDNIADNIEDSFCACQSFGSAGTPCNLPGEPECARGVTRCEQDPTTLATYRGTCHLEVNPRYAMDRMYCPNNAAEGSPCTGANGVIKTLRSRCTESPTTCGYLYCRD